MFKIQKTKKQTEELNSSKIKEALVSYLKVYRSIENGLEEGVYSPFESHILFDRLVTEISEILTTVCGNASNCEPIEDFDVNDFFVQSSDAVIPVTEEQTSEQINVGFVDQEDTKTTLQPVTQSLYKPSGSKNAGILDFLSRPVNIHTTNWAVGTSLDKVFYPWNLFFNHPSIKKKIDNYAFIRCDLHLKIMVNASPFYYGAAMYAYDPLEGVYNSASLPAGSDKIVGYSQRPHVIVYPQSGEGGEMVLPFIYHNEWLKLTLSDLSNMGTIHLDSFNDLLNANATSGTSVDIQVYAWAENVEMAGLTVLTVQSGYHKGPISKPASAIARSTGLLSKVPVIGPFMTATSLAANTVADIAGLFGYTKTPVIDDVKPVKNLPFHGLATGEISDCTERLCVDSKNELTINNECIGDCTSDPLNLSMFVQRPSYLTKFTWAASDAADALLWNSYVTPAMSVVNAGTGQSIVNGTPMWLVSQMFDYWRGDIVFDLKILCSQYHRGRMRISWDPVGDIANTADSSTEVYTTIVDVSETTNVSITIPYTQRTAYQKIPSDLTATIFAETPLAVDTSDTVNGIFTIRVLNEQTSPVSSADIVVLVSVRGAENLEFAAPKEIPDDLYYFTVQSGETITDVQNVDFGGSSSVDPHLNLVYMGEQVVNLRSLMMRCNYSRTCVNGSSLTGELYEYSVINRRPIFKGYDLNGVNVAEEIVGAGNAQYNFVKNTPYHMISQCFLGERGSFTWKFNLDGTYNSSITVGRPKLPLNATNYNFQSFNLGAVTYGKRLAELANDESTNSGIALINQETNTGLSVNAPQYSIVSFLDTKPSRRVNGLSNVSGDDSLRVSYISRRTHDVPVVTDPTTTPVAGVDYFHSYFQVGPDYSPIFFLNVPTMYVYSSVPVAV